MWEPLGERRRSRKTPAHYVGRSLGWELATPGTQLCLKLWAKRVLGPLSLWIKQQQICQIKRHSAYYSVITSVGKRPEFCYWEPGE